MERSWKAGENAGQVKRFYPTKLWSKHKRALGDRLPLRARRILRARNGKRPHETPLEFVASRAGNGIKAP